MRRFRPAAIDAAHQFGFTSQRRLPRAYHIGAEVGVGAPGLQGQRLGGVILGVDRGKRLQPLLDVLRVPRQQDRLLVSTGADDNLQPGDVLRLVNFVQRTGAFDVEAQRIFTVGGEIELLFALFGDGNIADRGIIFAGGDPQRPVFP